MIFTDLDHELITLIADNLPVKFVARLALTCKLGRLGAYNCARYNHMRKYKYVIREVNDIEHTIYTSKMFSVLTVASSYGRRLKRAQYVNCSGNELYCVAYNGFKYITTADTNNKITVTG